MIIKGGKLSHIKELSKLKKVCNEMLEGQGLTGWSTVKRYADELYEMMNVEKN